MSVGVGMFKYLSLMGIFILPLPTPTMNVTPMNMISTFTNGSLRYIDPWVVPCPEDVESYRYSMLPTPLTWVVDSLHSHDLLDTKLPLDTTIMDVMYSIDEHKNEVMHVLCLFCHLNEQNRGSYKLSWVS